MLKSIFGKKESEPVPEMAATIDAKAFKHALERYPALLKSIAKPPKEGQLSLEELDSFRYNGAPAAYSSKTGRIMDSKDLQKLVEWKLRHGTFRPGLANKVASNSDGTIAAASKEAFTYYAEKPSDITGVLDKLSKPLMGIGPATASLLLAVHDPSNVVFFSDELYRWLVHDGKKVSIKYTAKQFKELFNQAKAFMSRIKCTPIELEKVAFVIVKESEPAPEPKEKKAPSGLPRGRPKKPDSEKKVPSGRGRGRPPKVLTAEEKVAKAAKAGAGEAKKRGRKLKIEEEEGKEEADDEAEEAEVKVAKAAKAGAGEAKKRGRKPKVKEQADVQAEDAEETTATPASKKRKALESPASGTKRSGKKAKA